MILALCMGLLTGCYTYEPYPRPLGYHRIDIPSSTDRKHETFQNENCPFTFEIPSGGVLTRDNADSCWVDINFPRYNIKWHIGYREVDEKQKNRAAHFENYRRLIYKHTQKASRINELPVSGPNGYGIMFEVYGNVGTPAQLFFSDSAGTHIAMLSMYYRTAEKNDSLMPITNYMKEEMQHMVETMTWE